MPSSVKKQPKADSTANIGFEAKLWLAADKLRNNMDAAEYKHVVLGLIFLKYISDTFDEHHAKLLAGEGDYEGANPEDKDEYLAANVFWVPKEARRAHLQANAKLPSIGKDVDDAMVAIERDNPRLKGALNKNYGRADLDKHRLGELIDLIGSIQLVDVASRFKDLLGRVFEYFLTQFASAEGKNGGQFYTPSCAPITCSRIRRSTIPTGSVKTTMCAGSTVSPQGQRQLCLGTAFYLSPCSAGDGRVRPRKWEHVF
jgi:type I restriction enzyme M protein